MATEALRSLDDAPPELQNAIRAFFPQSEWDNAASVSYLESGWDAFAEADTRDPLHPCGSVLRVSDGIRISAEWSIGYFQINACNLPVTGIRAAYSTDGITSEPLTIIGPGAAGSTGISQPRS